MPFSMNGVNVFAPLEDEAIDELLVLEQEDMATPKYPEWGKNVRWKAYAFISSKLHFQSPFSIDRGVTFLSPYLPFLALNYFDRFASKNKLLIEGLGDDDLRFLVDCCMKLAVKYESPHLLNNPEVVANTEQMEHYITYSLNWRMNPITPLTFINFFIITRLSQWHHYPVFPVHVDEYIKKARNCIKVVFFDINVLAYQTSVAATCAVLKQIEGHKEYTQPWKRRFWKDLLIRSWQRSQNAIKRFDSCRKTLDTTWQLPSCNAVWFKC